MKRTHDIAEANAMVPLLEAIASEVVERRALRRKLQAERAALERASSPEGLSSALASLDARICDQDEGLQRARRELEQMGLTVLRIEPLTIHIQGQSRSGPVVFCWQEGEDHVCFGHEVGREEDARRPLRLKSRSR
ncbi:MAG: hypothetical protein Fur0037_13300 [Planctomycetota bacterium]